MCHYHLTWQQVKDLTSSNQRLTTELDTQVSSGRTANEQLQKLKGEASVLQLWQQNVQAERAAEGAAVKAAKQVCLSYRAESSTHEQMYVCKVLQLSAQLGYNFTQNEAVGVWQQQICSVYSHGIDWPV